VDLHLLAFHYEYYNCSSSEIELQTRLAEQVDRLEAIAASLD
jgi:hypothetical protein